MPITPYVRPQETITQILRMTPPPLVSRRNPLVIGPEYLLGNYDADNRYEHTFEAVSDALDYTYLDADGVAVDIDNDIYKIDLDSVQLIAEDLEVRVSAQSTAVTAKRGTLSTVIVQNSGSVYFTGPVGELHANLNDRAIRVGDILYVTAGGNDYRRTVVGFSTTTDGKATEILVNGVIPGDADDTITFFVTTRVTAVLDEDFLTPTSFGNIKPLDVGTIEGRNQVETATIAVTTVTAGNLAVTVTSSLVTGSPLTTQVAVAAADTAAAVAGKVRTALNGVAAITDHFTVGGTGATYSLTANVKAANDATLNMGHANGTSGGVTTAATSTDTFTGIAPSVAEVQYDQLTFQKAVMGVPTTGVDCDAVVPTGSAGRIAVYFRALKKTGALDGVMTINSLSDLGQLGTLHIDNPLAYGAYQAFKGNQSSKTYALRTNGESLQDFVDALDKIRATDYYYALAPMTINTEALEAVAAHCDEMSNKYNRNFRRCYLGFDSPGAFMIWGIKDTGDLRLATVDATNKRIIIDDDDEPFSNFLSDLSIGDTITLGVTMNLGEIVQGSGTSVTIKRIISPTEVEYTGTVTGGSSIALTATRLDSAANVVKYFSERNIGSRRAAVVWSDNPVTFTTTFLGSTGIQSATYSSRRIPMMYVAAEIAGLRCALLPQQGLTMTELQSIDTAPGMYTRFTPEQLDVIASQGVFICTQEIEGGEIFIRHQLTSQTDKGALAYEDNIGVIVDDFSYRVKDEFRQYLGRRNVNRETIDEIASKLKDLAIAATQETLANREIGPMVIRFFDENDKEGSVTVRVDGNLADHIVTYVRLRVPLPINGLDHFVDVETSVDL